MKSQMTKLIIKGNLFIKFVIRTESRIKIDDGFYIMNVMHHSFFVYNEKKRSFNTLVDDEF